MFSAPEITMNKCVVFHKKLKFITLDQQYSNILVLLVFNIQIMLSYHRIIAAVTIYNKQK